MQNFFARFVILAHYFMRCWLFIEIFIEILADQYIDFYFYHFFNNSWMLRIQTNCQFWKTFCRTVILKRVIGRLSPGSTDLTFQLGFVDSCTLAHGPRIPDLIFILQNDRIIEIFYKTFCYVASCKLHFPFSFKNDSATIKKIWMKNTILWKPHQER